MTIPSMIFLAGSAAAAAPAMTVEDLWAMERVGAPALSPDGRLAVVAVTRYSMADDKGNADLWLVSVAGQEAPRRLTWNEGADGSPAFSPDGKRIAFTSKRGDKPAQIYVLSLEGGEAQAVTDLPMAAQSPRWLKDGRIVFAADTWPDLNDDLAALKARLEERAKDKTNAFVSDNRLVRYWDRWLTDGSVPHLFVLDPATGKVRDLLPGSTRFMGLMDGADFDVSPEGTEVAFTANGTEAPYRTMQDDVFVVPVDGGPARCLTGGSPGDDGSARYSPDGRYLIHGRTLRPENDADQTHLVRLDRKTGESVPLAASWDRSPSAWRFSPDGATLYVHAEDRGRTNLFSLPVGKPEAAPRLLATGGVTSDVRAAADGTLVFLLQSLTRPTELVALDPGKAEPRPLTSFNAKRAEALSRLRVEDLTYVGAGGDPVQMWVVHPPGPVAGPKPTVFVLHGGPHGASLDSFHYRWSAALFASQGYLTVLPNFHGSTGFGQAFAESILGAHGDKPYADVMAALDLLVARGDVDGKRVAVAGGSYGGYLAAWILGQTDRFAAVVDHAGVYDLMAQFASDATYGRSLNYGASPWEDPARIDRWSPSRFAASFKTPTLILHGERDYRVPYTQGLNLYGILTAKGVPARLVVFPNENHWILKPQAARLWWHEVFAWIGRYTGTTP